MFPTEFVAFYLVLLLLVLLSGYYLHKRLRELNAQTEHVVPSSPPQPSPQNPNEDHNQITRTRQAAGRSNAHSTAESSTRQLIMRSLIDTWRLDTVSREQDFHTSSYENSELEKDILALRNLRLSMMKANLQYHVFTAAQYLSVQKESSLGKGLQDESDALHIDEETAVCEQGGHDDTSSEQIHHLRFDR